MKDLTNYFAPFYENVHFPIQVIDETGKIIYVNPEFSNRWGYELNELTEYSLFEDPWLRRNGFVDIIKRIFEDKTPDSLYNYCDSLLTESDITVPIFHSYLFNIDLDGQTFVVMLHNDETEMILTEEEVKKARDGFREAERLKNNFLNVLSHELRTPLNIILGYSSILKESLKDKISSEDKVYLDNLYQGSERLYKSITQMLEFAQIEAGGYKVNTETINLSVLLKNAIDNVKYAAAEKNLDVRTNFKASVIHIQADSQCVENAVNNLLNNAIKFTTQGFIEIEADIVKEREIAVCRIKDSGVGISTEYLDHLFQPFSQEDLNIGRNFEGNGLGLALAKRYIEKVGGSLLVDSIKGVGSTFTFTLPLLQAPKRETRQKTTEESSVLSKAFMLDDTYESYGLISAYLKNTFIIDVFDFRTFSLELLKNKEYKFFIVNVHQSHWEQSIIICKDIKRHDKLNRPVIILSSEFMEDKIKKFYEAGASKFIVKPFTKNDLTKVVDSLTKN